MDTPIRALRTLGISFDHAFSSECDARAREMLAANCSPDILYDDVRERANFYTPCVDLYWDRTKVAAFF